MNNPQYFPQFQNGRVINVNENPVEWYQLFDNNEPNKDFAHQALYGILDSTPLSCAYFSKDNIKLVNNMIRYAVYTKSNNKYIIGDQSAIDLEIIMRSVYLQNSRNLPFKIKDQIKELDNIVVNIALPRVISSIEQYYGYLYQIETLPIPIELPKNLSSAGTRILKSVTDTF
jgi:hypothetical protein